MNINLNIVLLPILFSFLGCSKLDRHIEEKEKLQKKQDAVNPISYTKIRSYEEIRTVIHDNHWFILWTENGKGGIIHHPDCPVCKK